MKKELLEYLRSASEGNNDIRRGLTDEDAAMGQRKLMDMCCQPHEVPIPDHCHNYIELVYSHCCRNFSSIWS